MWKLQSSEIWGTFVSISYTRENSDEVMDDAMFLYVDDEIEIKIVFYDKGERFSMRHVIDRRIVHNDEQELQNLWNDTYRHGRFDQ